MTVRRGYRTTEYISEVNKGRRATDAGIVADAREWLMYNNLTPTVSQAAQHLHASHPFEGEDEFIRTITSTSMAALALGGGGAVDPTPPTTLFEGTHQRLYKLGRSPTPCWGARKLSPVPSPKNNTKLNHTIPPPRGHKNNTTTVALPQLPTTADNNRQDRLVKGDYLTPLVSMFRGAPTASRKPLPPINAAENNDNKSSTPTASNRNRRQRASVIAREAQAAAVRDVLSQIDTFESNRLKLEARTRQTPEEITRKELEKFYTAKAIQVLRFGGSSTSYPTLAQLFEGLNPQQLEDLFIHCVGTVHGVLTFPVFCSMMQQLVGAQFISALTQDVLEKMFTLFDEDHSGGLDYMEYMSTLSMSLLPSDVTTVIQALFQKLDGGAKGTIGVYVFKTPAPMINAMEDLRRNGVVLPGVGSVLAQAIQESFEMALERLGDDDLITLSQLRVVVWTTPSLLGLIHKCSPGSQQGTHGSVTPSMTAMKKRHSVGLVKK
eukprot:PhM_4_TR13330/c0_g1_i1/m.17429